ncbi:MAG: LptF/LptG family permease [Pirellulaceae bacterium]|nr:LptF/LptG family permease [Pirellulaceae bacterium]
MLLTRIDRYLLLLYFRILLICFVSIAGLMIVIHLFSNLDDFDRHAQQQQTSVLTTLAGYYGPFSLSVFERVSAMLALLALLFTIGWINKTNELTALLAAGITKRRVARPLLAASFCVIASAAVLRETAIPRYQDRLDRKPSDLTGDLPRPIRPAYDPQTVTLIHGRHLVPVRHEIVDIHLKIQGGPLLDGIGNKLLANLGTYLEATVEHPAGYLLSGVHLPRNIDSRPSVYDPITQSPLLLTRHDHPWLEPGSCLFVSTVGYETLRGGNTWQQFASTPELITQLKAERLPLAGNDLRVSIHQRLVRPAIDWTVLLLGIPVLLSRPDRHMFWLAGVSIGMVGGFTAVVMGLAAIGSTGYLLSPQLAVWLPLLVFLPWGWAKTHQALET